MRTNALGVANVNNDVSSGIYSGLPMILSATSGREKKYLGCGISILEIIFRAVYSILRNKGNLHFIRILV